jgi:hypothetical protein
MIGEQVCEGTPVLLPADAAPRSLDATVALAKRHFATILVGAAFFGATLGMHRGGIQILYAALKLPLVVLLTAVVCTPVLTSLNRALNRKAVLAEDLSLVLASLARGCLILAALAPVGGPGQGGLPQGGVAGRGELRAGRCGRSGRAGARALARTKRPSFCHAGLVGRGRDGWHTHDLDTASLSGAALHARCAFHARAGWQLHGLGEHVT